MAVEHSRSIRAMARTWKKCRLAARPAGILAGTKPDTGWSRDQRVGWGLRASLFDLNTPPAFPHGMPVQGMAWSGIRTRYTQITSLLLYR